jgi:glutamate-ammonia-ligase adenylyltransferase
LAESLISAAYSICASALRREYGLLRNAFTGFTILAMGKLGGGELNFSSDVDLMYLYASDREDVGSIPAAQYFRRLSQKITAGLNELTGEGYVYRVDLRLRPEGQGSEFASSLDGFERYYQTRLRTWERLALLKAWPVSGNRALGRAFLSMVRPFIYDGPFDGKALDDVRGMKQQIDQKMAARQQRDRNVKLGTGGIREIELIAQSLQIRYGSRIPQTHERNTLKALAALAAHSILPAEEYASLANAYIFLRNVENKLQMVNDAQTHSLPLEEEELGVCARMLDYSVSEEFLRDYRQHTGQVNRIFEKRFSEPT